MKLQEARNIVLDLARQNVVNIKDNNEENARQWQAITVVEQTLLQTLDELNQQGTENSTNQEQKQPEPFDGASGDGSVHLNEHS